MRGLIGREDALAGLRAGLDQVASGNSGTVLFTGVPGVGKTRLARLGLELAEHAGFAVFSARAHAMSHELAYAPLVEAFGPALRTLDAAARSELIGDLDQLGLLFSGLGLAAPTPLGDPALERSRMLDGLARLIERLARRTPTALLVDDLHDADPASFAVLAHLIAGASEAPILLLLTTRLDEPGQQRCDELVRLTRESSWWLDHQQVPTFTAEEAAALVREVLGGRPIESALVDRIVGQCAGRAFLLEAMARTVVESGRLVERDGLLCLPAGAHVPLPEGVRAQMRSRLGATSPDERSVLEALAVAGAGLDLDSITRATGLGQALVVGALDSLHGRQLLGEAEPDRVDDARDSFDSFELVHPILRESLLAQLSPVAAQRYHARLVGALEARHPDDPSLPLHVLGAGSLLDSDQALPHLSRGADRAAALGQSEVAERYLSAAVPLARRGASSRLAELLERLGTAQRRVGKPDEAYRSWSQALQEYAGSAQPVALARVEQELGQLDWSRGALDRARGHFAAAERALAGLEPSPAHADLLFGKVVTASRVGDIAGVEQAVAELRSLGTQLRSPRLRAQLHLSEAVLAYANTDYLHMSEMNRTALAAAQDSGDPMLELRAYDQLSVAAASQLDFAAMREYTRSSLQVVTRLGAPLLSGWPRARLAIADLLTGDWDAALRATTDMTVLVDRYAERRGSVSSYAGHAWLLAHRGKFAAAHDYLDRAHQAASPALEVDRNVFTIVAISELTLGLFEDDPARAAARGASLEAATGGWLPLLGLGLLGEARARCGDVEGTERICARLDRIRSCATCAPRTLRSWVLAHRGVHDRQQDAAAAHFANAVDGFTRLGLTFLAARAQLHGSVVEPSGQAATALASTALGTFEQLGAPVQAQQARERLRALGVVPSRGRPRSAGTGPLSTRELEVARLVAAGASNAEVATALFISPRTVTTHLDRIYRRLGLSSRVALTRYLADSGLLDPSTDS